ncbi:prolipoprotein diacylglyceryl transferase [Longimicrobium terrae]|uniref:Phosphatidylglycerol--prolipoprotein diacylglyceryl transferase n=1 Tax=Longimicrobium terrae TaxID=1639882 RepID=A0A841GW97_9BACT|nr:prolipoprotein diacylglyceryl transferase [Longimicrobium terrae]MBB4634951.1 phosphatidylglycerol:prolipoprotein diacylglycerol transferase [Longimicrobium terrae]MBB6069345.1 phosphatidylglycerol:prolipoprotein diacylglycerol transferase [Longimicrobium terrae]NNC31846.1 prolipoprotein diacylglyceryl transferase [Longimicrobium terrae]
MKAAALLGLIEIPYPHVDPVALQLPFGLAVRWYGISFMVAFGAGYWLMRRLAARGFVKLTADQVGDLLFALIVGVILGGRLGYVLFYEFPNFAAHPERIIRIWEGGLSFHGGLAGAVAALAYFGRKHGIPLLRLGDGLSLVATPGILSVRMANFINGELYGRVTTDAVPWAMRFPTDPVARKLLGAENARGLRAREQALEAAYDSGLWDQVRSQVPLRHPSQLYEGLLEGLVLGLILWGVFTWTRRRGILLPDGTIGGMFLLGYGLFRSFVELFRQPDAQFTDSGDKLGTVLGPLTMGQTLSMVMIGIGLFLVIRGVRHVRSTPRATMV